MKNAKRINTIDCIAFFLVLTLFQVFGAVNQYLELTFSILLLIFEIRKKGTFGILIKNRYYIWMLFF